MFDRKSNITQRLQRIRERRAGKETRVVAGRKLRAIVAVAEPPRKTLWAHLVFTRIMPRKMGRTTAISRMPTVVNGLFNQVFALFTAVDLTRELGRSHLFVGNFYVQFNRRRPSVPLSRIIQLSSLLVPASDWDHRRGPTPSHLAYHYPVTYPADAVRTLRTENETTDLEIGCCLLFPLPGHNRAAHIQRMRFHPLFYELVSPFLQAYPAYQVVHYRMENDFTGAFSQGWGFQTHEECRQNLSQKYQSSLSAGFDPSMPTLVVSHYYKDAAQPRDHDLTWENLVHFSLSPEQKSQLCHHLQLPLSTPMREVDAITDFILCTTPHVRSFLGCGGSTFSESVCLFHNHQNCSLVNPHKMA